MKPDDMFIHCRKCVEMKPRSISNEHHSRLSVIRREKSIVIWCVRHDELVIEFECNFNDLPKFTCECCENK